LISRSRTQHANAHAQMLHCPQQSSRTSRGMPSPAGDSADGALHSGARQYRGHRTTAPEFSTLIEIAGPRRRRPSPFRIRCPPSYVFHRGVKKAGCSGRRRVRRGATWHEGAAVVNIDTTAAPPARACLQERSPTHRHRSSTRSSTPCPSRLPRPLVRHPPTT